MYNVPTPWASLVPRRLGSNAAWVINSGMTKRPTTSAYGSTYSYLTVRAMSIVRNMYLLLWLATSGTAFLEYNVQMNLIPTFNDLKFQWLNSQFYFIYIILFSNHYLIECTAKNNYQSNECEPMATQELKSIFTINKLSVFQVNSKLLHINFYSKQSNNFSWEQSKTNFSSPFSSRLIPWVWVNFINEGSHWNFTVIWRVRFLIKEGILNF